MKAVGAENFARLVDYADRYAMGARKFDMGERSAFQLVASALESLKWLNGLGLENLPAALLERTHAIEAAVQPLLNRQSRYFAVSLALNTSCR